MFLIKYIRFYLSIEIMNIVLLILYSSNTYTLYTFSPFKQILQGFVSSSRD